MYDFRDGLLAENAVYKNKGTDVGSIFLYILCILVCWAWGMAWLCLFYYAYIFHEIPTFWCFIVIWLVHFAIVVGVGALNIIRSKKAKAQKLKEKEQMRENQERIEKAKQKRHTNVPANHEKDKESNDRFPTEMQNLQQLDG